MRVWWVHAEEPSSPFSPSELRVSANVATERSSGESKGFGFLEFSNADGARAAITGLDGRDVNGQALKVNEAKPRKEHTVAGPSQH